MTNEQAMYALKMNIQDQIDLIDGDEEIIRCENCKHCMKAFNGVNIVYQCEKAFPSTVERNDFCGIAEQR